MEEISTQEKISSIKGIISQNIETQQKVMEKLPEKIALFTEKIIEAYRKGGKTIFFGNGGSAADSQHMAAEFVNRFMINRKPLPSLALTTDSSNLTSIGNDFGYDAVFEKQIRCLCSSDDVVIAYCTSDVDEHEGGHSANIAKAVRAAREIGAYTVGMGSSRGKLFSGMVDLMIDVPSETTARTQESHTLILHAAIELAESILHKEGVC